MMMSHAQVHDHIQWSTPLWDRNLHTQGLDFKNNMMKMRIWSLLHASHDDSPCPSPMMMSHAQVHDHIQWSTPLWDRNLHTQGLDFKNNMMKMKIWSLLHASHDDSQMFMFIKIVDSLLLVLEIKNNWTKVFLFSRWM